MRNTPVKKMAFYHQMVTTNAKALRAEDWWGIALYKVAFSLNRESSVGGITGRDFCSE